MKEKPVLIAVALIYGLTSYCEGFPFYANEIRWITPAPEVVALSEQYGDTSLPWGCFGAEPSTSGIRYEYIKKEKDGECIEVAKIKTLKFRYIERFLVWSYWGNFDKKFNDYEKITCTTCRSRWNNINSTGKRGDDYIIWHENRHKSAYITWNTNNSDGKGVSASLKQLEGEGKTKAKAVNDLEAKIEKNIRESISKDYRVKVNDEVHKSIGATFPVNKEGHEHGYE